MSRIFRIFFQILVVLLFLEEFVAAGGRGGNLQRPKKPPRKEMDKLEQDPGYQIFQLCNDCLFNQIIDEDCIKQIVHLAKGLRLSSEGDQYQMNDYLRDIQTEPTIHLIRQIRLLVNPHLQNVCISTLNSFKTGQRRTTIIVGALKEKNEEEYAVYDLCEKLMHPGGDPKLVSELIALLEKYVKKHRDTSKNELDRLKARANQSTDIPMEYLLEIEGFVQGPMERTLIASLKKKTKFRDVELYYCDFFYDPDKTMNFKKQQNASGKQLNTQ